MSGDATSVVTRRVAWVIVALLVVGGVGWALWSQGTQIPERIATEAAPELDWTIVAAPDDPQGLAAVPGIGRLVAPGHGEWTWHVTGPPEVVMSEVTAWLLQRPEPPDASGQGDPIAEIAADRGLEGRTWEGQFVAGGTTTLRGDAVTAFRSVTVTVVIQPVPITDDLTQVTIRVE